MTLLEEKQKSVNELSKGQDKRAHLTFTKQNKKQHGRDPLGMSS